MKCALQVALVLFATLCGSKAQAEDSTQYLEGLIAQAHAANPAPPKGRMLVEACVIGAPEDIVGFNRTTVINQFEDEGLVIEYIRAWTYGGTAQEAYYLQPLRVPLIEGPTALVQRAIVEGRWRRGAEGVSVLRPGESCNLYLPPGDWLTVISRVPITGDGPRFEAPDAAFNAGTGNWVERHIRVDASGYGSPDQWTDSCRSRFNGARCKIGPVGLWLDWILIPKPH